MWDDREGERVTAGTPRDALAVFVEPGGVVEVRAIGRDGRISSGYFNTIERCADAVDALDSAGDQAGIYFTMNPVAPSLFARRGDRVERLSAKAATTADGDIRRRRWMLVDLDPVKPSGISSTDAEKAGAFALADRIAGALDASGWPAPIRADSGNGAHLLYRVDLPNDAASTALVKGVLAALSARFSDGAVSVDTTTFNAARICRLYGTVARKGDSTGDRPHRRSKLITVPDVVDPVPVQLLQALVAEAGPVASETIHQGTRPAAAAPGDGLDVRTWLESHADALAAKGIVVREKPRAGHRFFGEFASCPFSNGAHSDGAFIGQADHGGIYARCQHETCGGAGGPNRWHEVRALVDPPKAKPKKATRTDDEADDEEEMAKTLSHFEEDGRLYVVAMDQNDTFGFLHLDDAGRVRFDAGITKADGTAIQPRRLDMHQDSGELMRVVGIPRSDLVKKAPLLDASALFREMNEHIQQYADMPEIEREIGIYYALFSWFYTKRSTSPYLRYIGDTGTGKSRCARAVADLCFLPILLSGGTSSSALMRMHEKWRGTAFIEEADLKGDAADPVVKWLNAGFERGAWIMLSDKNDPNKQQAFSPWGPKLLAMRVPFRDNATESRCLSYSPRETRRKDIPAELPPAYHETVADLRAKIARFVLTHWRAFDPAWVVDVDDIAPRVRQMSEPVSCILQYFPDGEERYRAYVQARQRDLKRTRAESREGSFFNEALARAQGEGDGVPVDVVTPGMIAETFKTTPTAVTTALKSIGFTIERAWVEVTEMRHETISTRKKKIRKLVVPSPAIWEEITSRYYFSEDATPAPECPDALRGSGSGWRRDQADPFDEWDRRCVQEVVQVVQPDDPTADPGPLGPLGPLTVHAQASENADSADDPGPLGPLGPLTVHAQAPHNKPGAYVCIQSNPNPCRQCGAAPSHYVASASGSPMIDMAASNNLYLCKACHGRQTTSPDADAAEVRS